MSGDHLMDTNQHHQSFYLKCTAHQCAVTLYNYTNYFEFFFYFAFFWFVVYFLINKDYCSFNHYSATLIDDQSNKLNIIGSL